jgi:hypothetical protein
MSLGEAGVSWGGVIPNVMMGIQSSRRHTARAGTVWAFLWLVPLSVISIGSAAR